MIYHVLPGDAVADVFSETGINGEIAVFRECLIDGEVGGESLSEFWNTRADFIAEAYVEPREAYFDKVVAELEKLRAATKDDEINLWFEYELFCSVNLWFCLDLLRDSSAAIYRVAPVVLGADERWSGFGKLTADQMEQCFHGRIRLSKEDIQLGADLWKAYRGRDYEKLRKLGGTSSASFAYLSEVCEPAVEREARPFKVLQKIVGNGTTEFAEIFEKFSRKLGVYGFGDAQVRRMLKRL